MRIIGGQLGGLRFEAPPGDLTRPTSDRVREGLASALQSRGAFESADVLDLFAGSGALSFEAISRGARRAVLVENQRRVVNAVLEVARTIGVDQQVEMLCLDLVRDPAAAAQCIAQSHPEPFDLVFADPPYQAIDAVVPLLKQLRDRALFHPGSIMVIEHATAHAPQTLSDFAFLAKYRYGDTTVVLLRCTPQGEDLS
jgi:16S rRNA (guanine966-N2)-methyltransferase